MGYSETIFVDLPPAGSTSAHARIYTPATELAFAGHPTVGAAWWLAERGMAVRTLAVPAGIVQVGRDGEFTTVRARADWSPEFVLAQVPSVSELMAADPAEYPDDVYHYLWTWLDRDSGTIQARMFANELGIVEDEATGSAAVRLTDHLSRDLAITQGKGSQIYTTWNPQGGSRWPGASSATASARSGERSAGGGDAVARSASISRSKSSAEENDRYTEAKRR